MLLGDPADGPWEKIYAVQDVLYCIFDHMESHSKFAKNLLQFYSAFILSIYVFGSSQSLSNSLLHE